ncbi:MAG: hypothetical protein GDA56_04580 [Hormoscilla sp. GM7CHS1pb]|nr:hypothetical protein [Hormoscilla sp. GM7CHS1pb]
MEKPGFCATDDRALSPGTGFGFKLCSMAAPRCAIGAKPTYSIKIIQM